MRHHLDPVIWKKLQAFARRRRSLIILRGVFAAVAMLVGTMILVAGVDYWQPLLPDWVRWALSAVAYSAVLVIAWRLCLDQLLHAPDERQIARLVEHAEPKLREDLLSAVELGRAQGDVFDSDEFRGLLQADVSARMQSLEVTSLLPVALLKRYIGIAAAIAVAVVALTLVSQNRFTTLFFRALLPGANLENVAGTQLQIVKPLAGDATVAQGDAVQVIVEVRGVAAESAQIEAISGEGRRVSPMKRLPENRFATTIQVGRENVRYRMQAGDGRTKYFQLTAVARPHEVTFEKTYHYPAYAQIPGKTVTEPTGGLVGLEGTEVELKITANQPLASGELRVDRGERMRPIPLVTLPDGRLSARLPLTSSGTYRLHLIAKQTGFESKFSPEYEVRAIPDLLPTVEFVTPLEDLIAPANELVKIVGHATDDVGLARVVQMVKVNERPWKEIVLKEKDAVGKQTRVEREWDLAGEGVKANDLITTKLVATDFKGGVTETRKIQIVVVAAATEMQRLAALGSRKALGEAVQAMAAAVGDWESAVGEARMKFDETEGADPARKLALAACAKAQTACAEKLAAAWTAVDAPLREALANHESSDLVLLGRLLSRISSGEVQAVGKILEILSAQPATPGARDLVTAMHSRAARAHGLADLARLTSAFNLSAEHIDVVAELGMLLSSEQRRVRELALTSKTPEDWGRIAARLNAVLNVTKNIDGVLVALKDGGGPIAAPAEGLLNGNFFASSRDRMQDALKDEPDEKLMNVFETFTRFFGRAVGDFINTKVQLSRRAQDVIVARGHGPVGGKDTPLGLAGSMHQLLVAELDPGWAGVEKLRGELAAIAQWSQLASAERTALSDERWGALSDSFKAHADLEEVRARADNFFVGDLRRASVATLSVLALAAGDGPEPTAARLDVLDQSMRVLAGGHDLQELLEGLTALVALDRWEIRQPHARTTMPRDWAWLSTRLQMAAAQLRRLDVQDGEARQLIEESAKALAAIPGSAPFRAVMLEMGERRKFKHTPGVARVELEQVAALLRAALAPLHGPMGTARRNLLKLTPSISELALALAKEEAALKTDSNQTATQAAAAQPADNKAAAAPQLARQQQINGKIETLKELIRADANAQNILQKAERDRMRDADDALAMLKDPPPAAAQSLLQVTQGSDATQQQLDLDQAVEQEQKIVDALLLIGGHFAALEQGKKPDETREALRQAEDDLGIKEQLDKDFAKAEMLAAMEAMSPEDLLKELEAKLPTNPEMAEKLDAISKDAVAVGLEELIRASKAETATAKHVDERIAKNQDPKRQLSVLAAAQLAAAATREAQAAAEAARQLAEQAANRAALERSKVAVERTTVAVPAADQLVEAAQRLTDARQTEQIIAEANAVIQKVAPVVQPSDHARNEAQTAANIAKTESQNTGPQQAAHAAIVPQATLAAEKSALAIEAARQAETAARDLAERAQAMAKIPDGAPQNPGLAQAAIEQAPVRGDAAEAAADIGRAARHAARLGTGDSGEKLGDIAKQIANTAEKTVPAAEQGIRASADPAAALPPVQKAANELADEVEALKKEAQNASSPPPAGEQAGKSGKPGESPAGEPTAATSAEQKEMAEALDALDQQLADAAAAAAAAAAQSPPGEGPPGKGPPGQGPPGPMAGMAQSAMASMRQGRSPKPSKMPGIPGPFDPKEKSEAGAKLDSAPPSNGIPPELAAMKKGDWGKLPKKLAEDLSKGRAEAIPDEYREAVEAYYRVIAERSRRP